MIRLLVFILCIINCKLEAQDNHKPGLLNHFHSFNSLHVLNGSTTTSLAIHTVNGFQSGKFFIGIGTGFDYYYHTSVPLFLEARADLLQRKGKLQLFGNAGLNFPFSSQNKKFEMGTGNYKAGSLYGAGIDYLVPFKEQALIAGVAFSNKHVIEMLDNNIWDPIVNRVENVPIKNDYSLSRIAIRIGWMF